MRKYAKTTPQPLGLSNWATGAACITQHQGATV